MNKTLVILSSYSELLYLIQYIQSKINSQDSQCTKPIIYYNPEVPLDCRTIQLFKHLHTAALLIQNISRIPQVLCAQRTFLM